MLRTARLVMLIVSSIVFVIPVGAQTPPAPPKEGTPPALLQIEREKVRPGKSAAHAVNRRSDREYPASHDLAPSVTGHRA